MVDTLLEEFDASPKKTIFDALSSDTDKFSAILELIDNSYTSWRLKQQGQSLNVSIDFDSHNRLIDYRDNAGGMNLQELKAYLKPGDTTARKEDYGISLYGVGAKRSSFFISSTFEVITRHGSEDTLKIKLDKKWFEDEGSWKCNIFTTDQIEQNSTLLKFYDVKFTIDDDYINQLKKRISEAFMMVIGNNFTVSVNGAAVPPAEQYEWLFLPNLKPVQHHYTVTVDGMNAEVTFTLGLLSKSSQIGSYGYDVICNGRLIARNLRDPEIGFNKDELGNPHARFARFKGIVSIEGPVGIMPWNSTKTGIDYSKPLFREIKERLVMHSKPYTRESNRLATSSIFLPEYSGSRQIEKIEHGDIKHPSNDYPVTVPQRTQGSSSVKNLPPLDTAIKKIETKGHGEDIYKALVEGIYVSDYLMKRTKFNFRNRYAFIILDNVFEVMLKRYIKENKKMNGKNERDYFENNKKLSDLIEDGKEIAGNRVDEETWKRILDFRDMRNNLFHVNPELIVPENIIKQFRDILVDLFKAFFNVDLKGHR